MLGCTVSEAHNRLTIDEFNDLIVYAKQNGGVSPHRRLERSIDFGFARLLHMLASIHSDPKRPKPKFEEFLPDKYKSDQDEIASFESFARSVKPGGAVQMLDPNSRWRVKKRE